MHLQYHSKQLQSVSLTVQADCTTQSIWSGFHAVSSAKHDKLLCTLDFKNEGIVPELYVCAQECLHV